MRLEDLEALLRPFECSECDPPSSCEDQGWDHTHSRPAMPSALRTALPVLLELARAADQIRSATDRCAPFDAVDGHEALMASLSKLDAL